MGGRAGTATLSEKHPTRLTRFGQAGARNSLCPLGVATAPLVPAFRFGRVPVPNPSAMRAG